jgi:hypothetical protein
MRAALATLTVSGLCGLTGCHETPEETQAKLLGELHGCIKELSPERTSPCVKLDLAPLKGIARQDIVAALGPPTFCTLPASVPKGVDCPSHYNKWSFYLASYGTLGGGPELTCDVDQMGHCAAVQWVNSQ